MLISQKYDLKRLASDIADSGVNLAESREEWITLMYSLSGGGKELLDPFLLLASRGSTYKKRESQKSFLRAMAKTKDDSLAWFLKTAQGLGYKLDDYLTPEGWQDREEWIERHRRGAMRSEELGVRSGPLSPNNSRVANNSSLHTPNSSLNNSSLHTPNSSLKMDLIPSTLVQRCRSNSSAFVQSLVGTGILTPEQAAAAADLYRLGAMRDGSVIFWQIDAQGQVREGKIMLYGTDCHRIKTSGAQAMGWMLRYKLKDANGKPFLPGTWHATPCLFGEHLINEELGVRSEEYSAAPNSSREVGNNSSLLTPHSTLKILCVVEAEKTAVILSQLMPDKLWLAAGGEQQLNVDKLSALQGRKVILYPDTDPDGATFANWQKIANNARLQLGLNISVSNLLETYATREQKQRKIDLVDFLTEQQPSAADSAPSAEDEETPSQKTFSPEVTSMIEDNPAMQDLIDAFDLVEVTNN